MAKHLIIATRGSALALWQANHVKEALETANPGLTVSLNVVKTKGDIIQDAPLSRIGGKGVFVKEIEEAILSGRADMAVHSMKDVPMELPEGLIIGCVPKREAAGDSYLSLLYPSLEELPPGSIVGTSSLRRQCQLKARRPDLVIRDLRGNIDTRIRKLQNGDYDAIILAEAGISRLDLKTRFLAPLDTDDFVPAVGQGALGIECHEDNYDLLVALTPLEDRPTRVCVDAERAFLGELDGGCQVPIAGHAQMLDEETIFLQGLVGEPDGSLILRAEREGDAVDSRNIGQETARELLDNGAEPILKKLYPAAN